MRYLKLFENFDINEEDECPICLKSDLNCECDYRSSDDEIDLEDDFDDEDSNINLSIELENKLRTLSDDSKLTIDDFLEEFGVSPEHMTDFAWASILKNAEQYKEMSDEEFRQTYDEYLKNK
jgi:hypothetical protein